MKNKEPAEQEQEDNSPSVSKHKEALFSRLVIRVGPELEDGEVIAV